MSRANANRLSPSLIALLGTVLLCGCPSDPKDKSSSATSPDSTAKNRARCEDTLNNAFSSLAPERLEISADVESAVNALNDWMAACGRDDLPPAELSAGVKTLLDAEQQKNVLNDRFTSRDAGHLRVCILCRTIAERIFRDRPTDLDRVVAVFEFVQRAVVPAEENRQLPLTPYEALLFGRGGERHQAWVMAEILRQLQIDSALLRSRDDVDETSWVMGVFLDGKTYLFDFSLSVPVPAETGIASVRVKTPATLDDVLERPEILDALRAAGSTLPTAEQLVRPLIVLPIDSSCWSGRQRALQKSLSGNRSFRISEELDGANGVLARISASTQGRWSDEDYRTWPYADQQAAGFWKIGDDQSSAQLLELRRLPLEAPFEVETYHPQTKQPLTRRTKKRLWITRVAHLLGDERVAIPGYGRVRLGETELRDIPSEILNSAQFAEDRTMLEWAADDAHFWTAALQLDLDRSADARATFTDYLHVTPEGRWRDSVRYFLGLTLAEEGDFAGALERLADFPQNSVMQTRVQYLRQRIEALANAPKTSDEAVPANP